MKIQLNCRLFIKLQACFILLCLPLFLFTKDKPINPSISNYYKLQFTEIPPPTKGYYFSLWQNEDISNNIYTDSLCLYNSISVNLPDIINELNQFNLVNSQLTYNEENLKKLLEKSIQMLPYFQMREAKRFYKNFNYYNYDFEEIIDQFVFHSYSGKKIYSPELIRNIIKDERLGFDRFYLLYLIGRFISHDIVTDLEFSIVDIYHDDIFEERDIEIEGVSLLSIINEENNTYIKAFELILFAELLKIDNSTTYPYILKILLNANNLLNKAQDLQCMRMASLSIAELYDTYDEIDFKQQAIYWLVKGQSIKRNMSEDHNYYEEIEIANTIKYSQDYQGFYSNNYSAVLNLKKLILLLCDKSDFSESDQKIRGSLVLANAFNAYKKSNKAIEYITFALNEYITSSKTTFVDYYDLIEIYSALAKSLALRYLDLKITHPSIALDFRKASILCMELSNNSLFLNKFITYKEYLINQADILQVLEDFDEAEKMYLEATVWNKTFQMYDSTFNANYHTNLRAFTGLKSVYEKTGDKEKLIGVYKNLDYLKISNTTVFANMIATESNFNSDLTIQEIQEYNEKITQANIEKDILLNRLTDSSYYIKKLNTSLEIKFDSINDLSNILENKTKKIRGLNDILTKKIDTMTIVSLVAAIFFIALILSSRVAYRLQKSKNYEIENRLTAENKILSIKNSVSNISSPLLSHAHRTSFDSIIGKINSTDINDPHLEMAEELTKRLGNSIIWIVKNANKNISLTEEINHNISFIELNNLKSERQISYRVEGIEIAEKIKKVPAMFSFDTIINSIEHGINKLDKNIPGQIFIQIKELKDNSIYYCIEDNGIGFDQSKSYKSLGQNSGISRIKDILSVFNFENDDVNIEFDEYKNLEDITDPNSVVIGSRVSFIIKLYT